MYKTGDIQKNIEKLKIELKQIKYNEKLDLEAMNEGNPIVFLPILHFALLSYSKYVAQFLVENNYELYSKSDKEFIDKIFKAMINLFNQKPTLNPRQFFSQGYAEAKIIFCLEVIKIVKQQHNNLVKKTYSVSTRTTIDYNNDNASTNVNFNVKNTNRNNVKVINHLKKNEGSQRYEDAISSPKFNDEEEISYSANQNNKYNFNKEIIKEEEKNKNRTKNANMRKEYEMYNLEDEQLDSDDYNDNYLNVNEDEKSVNLNEKISHPNSYYIDDIKDEKLLDNKIKKESEINVVKANKKNQKSLSNQDRNLDFTAVVEIINSLANSVKDMTGRIDSFKSNIESRVGRIEADVSLIKNRLTMLETQMTKGNQNKQSQNGQVTVNESSNFHDNNDHIFSFADEHPHNTQANIINENVKMSKIDEAKNSTISNSPSISHPTIEKNKFETLDQLKIKSQSFKNANSNSPLNSYSNNNKHNFINKIPSKILKNEIEDTDMLIQKVANRFKETQKLLNEFK